MDAEEEAAEPDRDHELRGGPGDRAKDIREGVPAGEDLEAYDDVDDVARLT